MKNHRKLCLMAYSESAVVSKVVFWVFHSNSVGFGWIFDGITYILEVCGAIWITYVPDNTRVPPIVLVLDRKYIYISTYTQNNILYRTMFVGWRLDLFAWGGGGDGGGYNFFCIVNRKTIILTVCNAVVPVYADALTFPPVVTLQY